MIIRKPVRRGRKGVHVGRGLERIAHPAGHEPVHVVGGDEEHVEGTVAGGRFDQRFGQGRRPRSRSRQQNESASRFDEFAPFHMEIRFRVKLGPAGCGCGV